jgi:hypothetical protein
MRMMGERLAPSVQQQRGGDLPAQPARVAAELEQRLGGRGKQQAVDRARVALGERAHGLGQGEHQMEVAHRQQFGAPGGEPAFLGQGLALGAVAVAARVVAVMALTASVALDDMGTQLRCAATRDRAQRPPLCRSQGSARRQRGAVAANDRGQIGSARRACPAAARERGHRALPGGVRRAHQQFQG